MNLTEAKAAWQSHVAMLAQQGVVLHGVQSYLPEDFKRNFALAMDAAPDLTTTTNGGIPAFLTTMIDPQAVRVAFAPTKAAEIFGEVQKGSWLDETAMFPVIEETGEVSSYGDHANSGSAGVNFNWPQRQSYLFQTVKQYGERELERAGSARINLVSEIDTAAASALNRFRNLSYFFGISGLQNYGALNDPNLTAALTPATKAASGAGAKWIKDGAIVATANEVFADIQALYLQIVTQTGGLVDQDTPMTLAMSPGSAVALTATNSFGISVTDLLKKNFPSITIKTAVQYGVTSASNPNGISGGNLVQLIAGQVDGQDVTYCAFNEKMRSHPIVPGLSSWQQKVTAGTWGAIIRFPAGIASMLGV